MVRDLVKVSDAPANTKVRKLNLGCWARLHKKILIRNFNPTIKLLHLNDVIAEDVKVV